MSMNVRIVGWLRGACVALLVFGGAAAGTGSVSAQDAASTRRSLTGNAAVATNGATLIHGNYCGSGNIPGKPPIDALDLACMSHDACTPSGGVPSCECNIRLRDEAMAVSRDPRQAPELRSLASLTAAAASVMICNPTITDAVATPPAAPQVAPAPAASQAAIPAAPTPVPPAPVPTVAARPVAAPTAVAPTAAVPSAALPPAAIPPAASSPPSAAVPAATAPAAAVSASSTIGVAPVGAPLTIVPSTVGPAETDDEPSEAAPVTTAPAVPTDALPAPRGRSLP